MKTLLKIVLALRGCRHRWEHYGTQTGEYVRGGGVARKEVLRCKRCGDLKNHVVS